MKVIILMLLIISSLSQAKDITILEIDTGVGQNDYNGHGTHIAGIILQNTCNEVKLVSCKYFNEFADYSQNFQNSLNCFKFALTLKPDVINYSSGGTEFNKEEYSIIKTLSDLGVIIVTAAGNEGQDLSGPLYGYYPAKYNIKNLIPVGNLNEDGTKNLSSNYGLQNMVWEVGTNVYSDYLEGTHRRMTGTSQATAVRSNRILKQMCSENK